MVQPVPAKPKKTDPAVVTPWNNLGRQLAHTLDEDELTNCMRCGFCLPACPTYRETGLEAASPRGRIALMKAAVDGWMTPDESFRNQMNFCLGCRACETACPADVRFGRLLEQSRAAIAEHAPITRYEKTMRHLFFQGLFPHRSRLRLVGALLALYQKSGLRWLVHRTGLARLLPPHLRQMDRVLPTASMQGVVERIGTHVPAHGKKRGRVGLLRGCIMDVAFADTNVNTARLLSAAGYEVVIPRSQTCCGALHAHSGEERQAHRLAKENIRTFREAGVDWVASNAGGCGAQLVEYSHLLQNEPKLAEDARWFAAHTRDISQLLAEGNPLPLRSVPKRVTYQHSCHLKNGMKVSQEPESLIRSIPDLTYMPLNKGEHCCGSAGIYNLTHPETSMHILDEKMNDVKETTADILVTTNPGCLLQMKLGIERSGLASHMQAVHLVDLLTESMEKGDDPHNQKEK
ncbi:(Fe-S)-binding protein [Desmospora profundinema]|uniref:Glycolate oxidase iron-sulfur subunit n=1 Tax=Desmospora profundinema TaxID=1571184 RepID=A0ABU1INC2_9BACL|nr:(Fe-S)-binding protein [Desmospora profundinema]MDR6226273.1 glycolate oxidase iron-sulfur subunit [Desmospora profundinema]